MVTPQGVVRCDVAIAGETIAAIAAPDALPAQTARAGDRCHRAHRHAGRHRPARASASCVDQAGWDATRYGRPRAGRTRCAVWRHDDVHRFRLLARWRCRRARPIEARDQDFVGKSPCDWAYHIMLHSEPPPEFAGQLAEAIEAGYPTLKIFTTNILPSRTGPHDRFRRHLGGVPGAGEVGRARRHPRRGQRHRHAHVCQADPRGPGRLRASRRSP